MSNWVDFTKVRSLANGDIILRHKRRVLTEDDFKGIYEIPGSSLLPTSELKKSEEFKITITEEEESGFFIYADRAIEIAVVARTKGIKSIETIENILPLDDSFFALIAKKISEETPPDQIIELIKNYAKEPSCSSLDLCSLILINASHNSIYSEKPVFSFILEPFLELQMEFKNPLFIEEFIIYLLDLISLKHSYTESLYPFKIFQAKLSETEKLEWMQKIENEFQELSLNMNEITFSETFPYTKSIGYLRNAFLHQEMYLTDKDELELIAYLGGSIDDLEIELSEEEKEALIESIKNENFESSENNNDNLSE